jgi:hypothetical protein
MSMRSGNATPSPTSERANTNIGTCAFGHHTHKGTCGGCQRVQALRHAAQLNAAATARAQWLAHLH